MQQLLTQACTAVMNIANNCLEADKSNKTVEPLSQRLLTEYHNGKIEYHAHQWEKNKIKTSTFWRLPDSLWPGFLPVSISFRGWFTRRAQKSQIMTLLGGEMSKIQKTGLASTKKKPSTSIDSLNYQGWKKNYSDPQHRQSRQNYRKSLHRYQKRNLFKNESVSSPITLKIKFFRWKLVVLQTNFQNGKV